MLVQVSAESAARQPCLQKLQEMEAVNAPEGVIVQMGVDEVPRKQQRFRRVQAAGLDSQRRLSRLLVRENAQRVDQTEMVEFPVRHTCVVRIAKEVVHPIDAECISDDDLRKDRLPGGESHLPVLFWAKFLGSEG